jgi:6-pyruvoyltetrahydropterin/6-carboxytetrahydropterin synthase
MDLILSRTERFSAAHRLHSAALTPDENRARYGKCTGVHGHNYVLEVGVGVRLGGDADRLPGDDGMVMNLAVLGAIVQRAVLDELDHANIDEDVAHFRGGVPSTAENIALYAWQRVSSALPSGARLVRLVLRETDRNVVEIHSA